MPGQHSLTEEDVEALMGGRAPGDEDPREERIRREHEVQELMRVAAEAMKAGLDKPEPLTGGLRTGTCPHCGGAL
jgi:hypothetical protein